MSRRATLHKLHSHSTEDLLKTGIYTITSISIGRIYVGSATISEGMSDAHKGFRARWGDHVFRLLHNKHHSSFLQNHVNKYGIDDLSFEILEFCEPRFALSLERYWISMLDSVHSGFNCCYPGLSSHCGRNHPRYISLNEEEITALCKDKNLTAPEIAKLFNVSVTPIKRILLKTNTKPTKIDYDLLYKEYINSYGSMAQLAARYSIAESSIRRGFIKHGLPDKIRRLDRDCNILYNRYLSGDSIQTILAREYKVSHYSIYRVFQKHSLKIYGRYKDEDKRKELLRSC